MITITITDEDPQMHPVMLKSASAISGYT